MIESPNFPAGPGTSSQATTIDAEEYCHLAVSSRKMLRVDDHAAGTRTLVDVETGEQFVAQENALERSSIYRV